MKITTPGLSIIIPVYNERENILKTLKEIKKHVHFPHETIIVYDTDKDTTLEALKRVKKRMEFFTVKNEIAKGPSGAIRTGILHAKSQQVLITMADLCDDLSQVKTMMKLIDQGAGIICPSRYCPGGEQQLKGSLKVWTPKIAGYLLRMLTGIPTVDPTNSYKLYSRRIFDKIELKSTTSFSVTLEIVVKAYAAGFKIVEIPTVWKDRQHGKTNFKLFRSIVAYFPWFCYGLLNSRRF